jgi:hypothetical protein
MTREEFKTHVEATIESSIQQAEKRIGQRLERRYCFNWIGAKTEPVPQERVVEFITQHAYIDSEHIYPCFDIGVGEMLDDGRLLLVGYRASYPPRPWGKNWTGRDGPFVFLLGQKFLDNYPFSQTDVVDDAVDKQRREIVRVTRGILDGNIGIIAGARQLTRLRFPSRAENDSDILLFVGIDSETDHLPLGEVRRHWNPEVLKVKDAELEAFEAKVRERAFAACQSLIQKLKNHSG